MFEYQGVTYNMKPINIGLRNKTLYFISELNKYITKNTFGIDLSINKKFQDKINELQIQLNQSTEYLDKLKADPVTNEKQINEYEAIVIKQTAKLEAEQTAFNNDEYCSLQQQLYNSAMAFAMEEFITNEKLITDFVNVLLDKPVKINIDSDEGKMFIIKVVNFFLTNRN